MNKINFMFVILVACLCMGLFGLVISIREVDSVILTTNVYPLFKGPFITNPKACEITTTLSNPPCSVCSEPIEVSTKPTSNVVVIVDFVDTKVSTTVYHKQCLIEDSLQEGNQQGEFAHEYEKSHSSSL